MKSHLKDINENYFEHMVLAQKYGLRMIMAGIACIIHSVIPNIFISTASNTIQSIIKEIENRKHKANIYQK